MCNSPTATQHCPYRKNVLVIVQLSWILITYDVCIELAMPRNDIEIAMLRNYNYRTSYAKERYVR